MDAKQEPRLPYRVIDGRGPILFCVHGMLSSHAQWTPNLEALAAVAQPVLFDLWGHGDAPSPEDDAVYTIEAIVAEFERAREELGAKQVALLGQSLGAALTLRYAITHPQRVLALVFTNSRSALMAPERLISSEDRAARAQLIEGGGVEALRKLPFHPRHARRLAPEAYAALVAAADAVDPGAAARITRVTVPRVSALADLHRISCPTLLANGRYEKRFQPLRAVAEEEIPGCRIADIDGGHAVNLENPEQFNAAVTAFLREVLPKN